MFSYSPLFALASLAVVTASPIFLSERSGACSNYTIVSTRGTGEFQGPSLGFKDMIKETLQAVPGGIEYDTKYPAGIDQQSAEGTKDIIDKVTKAETECHILLGYSQGAAATTNALKELTGKAADSIKAVLMLGNPQHKAGLACNVDSKGGNSTFESNGVSVMDGGIPSQWISRTLDICADGDGVCDYTGDGVITGPHLSYIGDEDVQKMGAAFLIKALQ